MGSVTRPTWLAVSATSPANWPRGRPDPSVTGWPPLVAGPALTSSPLTASNVKRPLSHSQPWLTGSESSPSSRVSRLADDCTATRHPGAQVVQVASTWSRAEGRAVNRYGVAVRAPTGQIWTVLPLKYEENGWAGEGANPTSSPPPAKSIWAS